VTTASPAKTEEPIEMPYGEADSCGSDEPCFMMGAHWRHLASTMAAMQSVATISVLTCLHLLPCRSSNN